MKSKLLAPCLFHMAVLPWKRSPVHQFEPRDQDHRSKKQHREAFETAKEYSRTSSPYVERRLRMMITQLDDSVNFHMAIRRMMVNALSPKQKAA